MESIRRAAPRGALAEALALLACGCTAGAVNGLLGAGGGIIVVLLVGALQKKGFATSAHRAEATSPEHVDHSRDVYATSLLAMLPISVFSALQYVREAGMTVSAAELSPFLLPALVGGVLGGLWLDRMRLPLLRAIFAAVLLISGARMLFG